MEMSRRKFLGTSATAVLVAGTMARGKVLGANERLRGGVIGFNGRGRRHIEAYVRMKEDIEIAALCDVDSEVLAKYVQEVTKQTGKKPHAFADMRKMLELKDLDFVSIATPNHWHALASIWACQAGKDVYVEKPLSHSVWEGRQLANAQKKYDRIVQHGTQSRSDNKLIHEMKLIHEGIIGEVIHARGYVYKTDNRAAIGHGKVAEPPKNLDYLLWQGPAKDQPYKIKERSDKKAEKPEGHFVHYDWHWFWEWGNGEIGNQGVHQMDIASWAHQDKLPVKVQSMGGRYVWDDDGQTPNTMATTFTYEDGSMTTFEVRNVGSYGELDSKEKCSDAIFGTKGYYQVQKGFFDYKDNPIEAPKGDTQTPEDAPFKRFAAAVRSRKPEDNPCDALTGHLSCTHCHLGNIAYRLGRTLQYDPKTERFVQDDEANTMLKRDYRPGFEVPEIA